LTGPSADGQHRESDNGCHGQGRELNDERKGGHVLLSFLLVFGGLSSIHGQGWSRQSPHHEESHRESGQFDHEGRGVHGLISLLLASTATSFCSGVISPVVQVLHMLFTKPTKQLH
jgi:hypothetical protein